MFVYENEEKLASANNNCGKVFNTSFSERKINYNLYNYFEVTTQVWIVKEIKSRF